MDEFLLGMLASSLRGNIDNITFQKFQHGLLDTLT